MKDSHDNVDVLIVDSLLLAYELTCICKIQHHNKKLMHITGRAWCRHWRRVQKAIDAGKIAYEIPTNAFKDCK
jgi:hypothetical protein